MDTETVLCPYCGERLEVFVDRSIARQEYIEDCQVCCRPITLAVTVISRRDDDDGPVVQVAARAEQD